MVAYGKFLLVGLQTYLNGHTDVGVNFYHFLQAAIMEINTLVHTYMHTYITRHILSFRVSLHQSTSDLDGATKMQPFRL
jgi:hypothetical protein